MKAVILAGGFGTRISEESTLRPKPMIEVGGKPLLWHIMKIYSKHGINDFIICLGYKGYIIKEYFSNYFLHMSDVTYDMKQNKVEIHKSNAEPWIVTMVDTGDLTMTGGRIKRIQEYVKNEDFCCTYGDGLSDVNITNLIQHHKKYENWATLTAAKPPGRFGVLNIKNSCVKSFDEKPDGDGAWINGGFFVLSPKIFDLIDDDETVWEREPLEKLVALGQLSAFKHSGFWQSMDTLRDKNYLEKLWADKKAPWKIW
jgi:glucose-1-phosphate cytidylyltransferase